MLRKHMICYDHPEVANGRAQFYAWQCVTLQLTHREVDLVIKKESEMDAFLLVLIHGMNTCDGNKGSAERVKLNLMRKKELAMKREMNLKNKGQRVQKKKVDSEDDEDQPNKEKKTVFSKKEQI